MPLHTVRRPQEREAMRERKMLLGKIHRATVTGAELHYEGSVTIDRTLMERAACCRTRPCRSGT